MSPGGRSERMGFLREAIARIGGETLSAGARRGGLCEVLPARHGDAPAAAAFALALARDAAQNLAGPRGAIVWIGDEASLRERGALHAPGFWALGLDPEKIVLVRAADTRSALWAIEEALRSPAPAAVVGEVENAARHCDLQATRRFLLAARAGGVLGVLLHGAPAPGALSTAARERFEVRAMPGLWRAPAGGRLPVFGAPAWRARRLKGQGAQEADDTSQEREFSSAALSQPVHSWRARA